MTSGQSISHATYFLQSSLTPDGRTLVFTSYRSGSAQLYSIEPFPDGPIRQLTVGAAIHPFSPTLRPDGLGVLFVRGSGIWHLSFDNLEECCVAEFPGAQLGEPSLSADGWITAAVKQGSVTGLVVGRLEGGSWSLLPFPRTVIHPQFHPLEPEWIEFAGDPAPRMHRIRRDGSGLECLLDHDDDTFVVHETFLGRTGDIVFTIWPRALLRMDWTTRQVSTIAEFNAWHITPDRSGSRVLCDTNHPDLGIFLIDAANGGRTQVCLSGATNQGTQWRRSRYALASDFAAARSAAQANLSWMETSADSVYGPQWTHPHPSFSPDETQVVFSSDRTGVTQVYVAGLDLSRDSKKA